MNDKDYIQALAQGDNTAIRRLYSELREPFFRYFLNHYRLDDDTMADLLQEAVIGTWKNVQRGTLTTDNLTCRLSTYVITIGIHRHLAATRQTDKFVPLDTEQHSGLQDMPDDGIYDTERENAIARAVEQMTEPCNTLLRLFYYENKDMESIAQEMNYPSADAAKTQKYRCMQKLKTVFAKLMEE
ncbi:MAG: sigma-70 family RNA polymerase sigma factor [Paludibacteraceae bacterium]|nr:sigma-70 family RNA polymerase sigma factor [Paludibacteraceae bacterium]